MLKGFKVAKRRLKTVSKAFKSDKVKRPGSSIRRLVGSSGSKSSNKSVGRPRGSFKNPYGVPAQQYYKIKRQQKAMAKIIAEKRQLQIQQQLAQRGITPEQLQQIQMQRQIQENPSSSQEEIVEDRRKPVSLPQQPGQVRNVPPGRPIWIRKAYLDTDVDLMGNQKEVVRGNATSSMWN